MMSEMGYETKKPNHEEINQLTQNTKSYEELKKNPTISKIFSDKELETLFQNINQESINKYGTQVLLGLLVDFNKKNIDPNLIEQEVYVLEQIDISEELLLFKQEILNKNNSVIDTNSSVIDTNSSVIDTKAEHIYQKIDDLKNMYENSIEPIFKPNTTSTERQQFYQEKRNVGNIESILKKNNIDPNFYFQIRYTAEQLIKESGELSQENIQFIQQFNTLNKSLNIDYQINIPIDRLRNTPKPNNLSDIIKTPNAMFAYPSVREYSSNQPDILSKEKKLAINPKLQQDIRTKAPKEKQEELWELIKKNCLDNKLVDIQDLNYSATIDIQQLLKNPDTISDTTKTQIQTIIDTTLSSYAHDYLITQTNTFAKKAIISQAVAGLAGYFDTTTNDKYSPGTQNYATDFDLSDDGNIDIQDNVLHISGKMYGQIVHFFYNLETGELQANDYLYKVMEAQSFLINDPRGRVTLPTKLPSIKTLQAQSKSINYKKMIRSSSSRENYETELHKVSTNTLSKKFNKRNYNKAYIQRINEKNLFIQETLDIINQSVGGDSRNLRIAGKIINLDNSQNSIEITRSLHPNEYELLMLLDRTSQHYRSPDQLRTIRQQLKDIMNNTNIKEGTHPDPVLNKLFREESLIQDQENWNNPAKKSNFLLFIDLISNKKNQFGGGIIDISLLGKIVDRINKKEILLQKSDPRHFKEKYEKILDSNV